jgi:hypothetical protein
VTGESRYAVQGFKLQDEAFLFVLYLNLPDHLSNVTGLRILCVDYSLSPRYYTAVQSV